MKYLLFVIFLLSPTLLFGEQSVIFRDGKVETGQVIGQDSESISFRQENGQVVRISKKRILKIVYGVVTEKEATKIKIEEEKKTQTKKEILRKKEQLPETASKETISDTVTQTIHRSGDLSRIDSAVRSAILPGWGMWASGKQTEAFVLGGVTLVSALFVSHQYSEFQSARPGYKRSQELYLLGSKQWNPTLERSLFLRSRYLNKKKDYLNKVQNWNQSANALAVLYLSQIAYSFFFGGVPEDKTLFGIQWASLLNFSHSQRSVGENETEGHYSMSLDFRF